MRIRYLPNIITIIRIACVPLLIAVMMQRDFHTAFYLTLALGISDAIDGFLAKHFSWQSKIGAYLDPLADKFLIIAALILFQQFAILPLWLVVLAIGRDVLIVAGCIALRFLYGETEFRPHWSGKISTFLQFILIVVTLIIQFTSLPSIILPLLINITAAAAVISGVVYITAGWNMLMNASRQYNL